MAEQGMSNPSQHESHSSTTETSPFGTAAITWISAHRWATVAAGIAVVALIAAVLGASLGSIALIGVVLLCPLMMVAMGHGMHRMHVHGADQPASGAESSRGDPALAILRERYARGELSDEQYDRMRRDLT